MCPRGGRVPGLRGHEAGSLRRLRVPRPRIVAGPRPRPAAGHLRALRPPRRVPRVSGHRAALPGARGRSQRGHPRRAAGRRAVGAGRAERARARGERPPAAVSPSPGVVGAERRGAVGRSGRHRHLAPPPGRGSPDPRRRGAAAGWRDLGQAARRGAARATVHRLARRLPEGARVRRLRGTVASRDVRVVLLALQRRWRLHRRRQPRLQPAEPDPALGAPRDERRLGADAALRRASGARDELQLRDDQPRRGEGAGSAVGRPRAQRRDRGARSTSTWSTTPAAPAASGPRCGS